MSIISIIGTGNMARTIGALAFPDLPSRRSVRCLPCTEAISKRTVTGQRTMQRISDIG